jgi:thioredoxin reductase
VRGQRLCVLGADVFAANLGIQLTRYSQDVVMFTNGPPEFDEDAAAAFKVCGLDLRTEPVEEIVGAGGRITEVRLAGGGVVPRDAMFIKTPLDAHGDLAESLGCELMDDGSVKIDEHGHTTVGRVYAAGEAARLPNWPSPWIHAVTSAALGAMVALSIDHDLIVAEVQAKFES